MDRVSKNQQRHLLANPFELLTITNMRPWNFRIAKFQTYILFTSIEIERPIKITSKQSKQTNKQKMNVKLKLKTR